MAAFRYTNGLVLVNNDYFIFPMTRGDVLLLDTIVLFAASRGRISVTPDALGYINPMSIRGSNIIKRTVIPVDGRCCQRIVYAIVERGYNKPRDLGTTPTYQDIQKLFAMVSQQLY